VAVYGRDLLCMAALMIRNELGKLIDVQRSEYRMLVHDGAERKALITADQLAQFGYAHR